MYSDQLDLWQDEVDALPWGGHSPRLLAAQIVQQKVELHRSVAGTCVVDNSSVGCRSREAQRFDVDPAQLMLCIGTSFQIGG